MEGDQMNDIQQILAWHGAWEATRNRSEEPEHQFTDLLDLNSQTNDDMKPWAQELHDLPTGYAALDLLDLQIEETAPATKTAAQAALEPAPESAVEPARLQPWQKHVQDLREDLQQLQADTDQFWDCEFN